MLNLNAQILEGRYQLLQVHFPVHVLIQMRELQPQILLVLPHIVDELGESHIATVGLVGGFQELL